MSQKGKEFKVSVLLFENVKPLVYLQAKTTFSGMIGYRKKNEKIGRGEFPFL